MARYKKGIRRRKLFPTIQKQYRSVSKCIYKSQDDSNLQPQIQIGSFNKNGVTTLQGSLHFLNVTCNYNFIF